MNILSATYSHRSAGNGLLALEPLVTFAALAISYWTRHVHRLPAVTTHSLSFDIRHFTRSDDRAGPLQPPPISNAPAASRKSGERETKLC